MNPSDVAFKAADIMSERGIAKKHLSDIHGQVCFAGAIHRALVGSTGKTFPIPVENIYSVIERTASEILYRRCGIECGPVPYNDMESTSAEDVISLLKETAACLAERGE